MVKTDGPGNKCSKTDWYDLLNPEIGITTTRNQKLHDQRRRVWLPAVSAKELKVHEQTIVAHAHKMDSLISQAADAHSVVDFSSYAYWLSFDVMGVFALSESFDMLHNEQWHHVIKMMRGAMGLMGPVSPVPWVAQIGFKYLRNRWLVKDWFGMIGWCRDRMNERVGEVDKGHDIASWVIADSRKKGTLERDGHILTGDAVVAVIAGSDTAASTMIFLFLELAKNPQKAEKLLEELQTIDMDDRDQLHALPYLNALVEETLRLHPAVPTGGYRETPPEGIQIAGRYIPGNTNIVAPRHSLGRLERCFERAHEFIPERWTTEPQMVRDRRAFQPFAQGKNIALTELRTVTAMLVSKYHIRLPPGDDGSVVEAEAKDHFTAVPGKLRLVFEKRVEELVQAQGWEDAAEMV
ncbi:MAG: hypothetical protein M1831_007356 [Alyxoria varia]|nr:MAG: hypothetical protein M1831_007356 [Alyxoria varia]